MQILLRLLAFARPYRGRMLLAWLCILLSGGFVLLTPQVVAWAVDFGLGIETSDGTISADVDWPLLLLAAAAILASSLARGAFAYGQQFLGEWIGQAVAYDLRNAIYDRLQRLSYAYHDTAQTGQLMSRATVDVDAVRMYYDRGILRAIYLLLLLIAIFVLMARADLRLALVAWALIPFLAAYSVHNTMRLRKVWSRIQDRQGDLGAVLQENITGVRVVRAFGQEERETRKFDAVATALYDDAYTSTRIQAFSGPFLNSLWLLAIVGTNWYGARLVVEGNLTLGELSAFNLYLTMLQGPIRIVGWMIAAFARAISSGHRVFEILDAESAVQERPGAPDLPRPRGHVRFEGVSFSYDSVSPTLSGIDIDAPPGSLIALLGPTGSGKTTVVNLIPRFYDVTGGRITIDGTDIRDTTLTSLRRAIGIVQQDVFLFSATIRDNLAYGAIEATQEQIVAAAKAAQIHDFIVSLPDGYDTWVGERGITLSGGQKQRVAIARTLLLNPPILVLDDATSSVDTRTEQLIQRALERVVEGRTTFVVAQRLKTVKSADQVLVLDQGRIVERGKHDELLAQDGYYRRIYEIELAGQEATSVPAGVA